MCPLIAWDNIKSSEMNRKVTVCNEMWALLRLKTFTDYWIFLVVLSFQSKVQDLHSEATTQFIVHIIHRHILVSSVTSSKGTHHPSIHCSLLLYFLPLMAWFFMASWDVTLHLTVTFQGISLIHKYFALFSRSNRM